MSGDLWTAWKPKTPESNKSEPRYPNTPQPLQSSPRRTTPARPGPAPGPRSHLPSDSRPLPAAAPPSAGVPCAPVFSVAGRSSPSSGGHESARAVAFLVGESGLRIGGTGQTSRLDASDGLGHPRCLVGLRFDRRQGCLPGQLICVHDHKPERLQGDPPVTLLHLPTPHDTLPVPLAWGLLPGAARFFAQQGQGALPRPP